MAEFEKAVDLASFHNLTPLAALAALRSGAFDVAAVQAARNDFGRGRSIVAKALRLEDESDG